MFQHRQRCKKCNIVIQNGSHWLNGLGPLCKGCLELEKQGDTDSSALPTGNDSSPLSAITESYPALQWRDEPPTEEGWYWIQTDPDIGISPRPVKVSRLDDGQLWVIIDTIESVNMQLPLETYQKYRWAGPIPEPDEAESAG